MKGVGPSRRSRRRMTSSSRPRRRARGPSTTPASRFPPSENLSSSSAASTASRLRPATTPRSTTSGSTSSTARAPGRSAPKRPSCSPWRGSTPSSSRQRFETSDIYYLECYVDQHPEHSPQPGVMFWTAYSAGESEEDVGTRSKKKTLPGRSKTPRSVSRARSALTKSLGSRYACRLGAASTTTASSEEEEEAHVSSRCGRNSNRSTPRAERPTRSTDACNVDGAAGAVFFCRPPRGVVATDVLGGVTAAARTPPSSMPRCWCRAPSGAVKSENGGGPPVVPFLWLGGGGPSSRSVDSSSGGTEAISQVAGSRRRRAF
mmetsp:Transcript_16100/g.65029  ORF Transcript_16100/g.65029 Transcript_16100/m.65029 type:complete len:318 (-) Transcript_16100:230-1183(-)